jgi:hypothetical protein
MTLKPKDLNIPLHKRDLFWFRFVVASFGVAVLLIKPSTLTQWVVTLILVAPTVWLFLSALPRFTIGRKVTVMRSLGWSS